MAWDPAVGGVVKQWNWTVWLALWTKSSGLGRSTKQSGLGYLQSSNTYSETIKSMSLQQTYVSQWSQNPVGKSCGKGLCLVDQSIPSIFLSMQMFWLNKVGNCSRLQILTPFSKFCNFNAHITEACISWNCNCQVPNWQLQPHNTITAYGISCYTLQCHLKPYCTMKNLMKICQINYTMPVDTHINHPIRMCWWSRAPAKY